MNKGSRLFICLSVFGLTYLTQPPVVFAQLLDEICPSPCPECPKGTSGPRLYYVTKDIFDANDAPAACEAGFHMASLWEIFDPSNLRYDTTRGLTYTDSGSGPPIVYGGSWVRTGAFSTNAPEAGSNCLNYTSDFDRDWGTGVRLKPDFENPNIISPSLGPWEASVFPCHAQLSVWCIEDWPADGSS